MKKQAKRLTLHKETLMALESKRLQEAVGGSGEYCSIERCPYSWYPGPECAIDSNPCQ
jgi:hypothetical protein